MVALRLGQMLVGAPFVGIDGGSLSSRLQDAGLKIPSCAVFLRAIGSGHFPARRSPRREDGPSPTCHGPVLDWRGAVADPPDPGVNGPSRPHSATSHPPPPPRRPTAPDDRPVPQAPEFYGDVQASACGQYPILSPSARSVCLGQSPARCARSHSSCDGSLARGFRRTRCRYDRRNSESTASALYRAYALSTVRPASHMPSNTGHPDAESRPDNRNTSAHPSTRLLSNGSSAPPSAIYYGELILYLRVAVV